MMSNKKFALRAFISALCLVLCLALCLCAVSCAANSAPALEDVYDRVVYLIESSYDVNMFLFGEGLPVIKFGSEYAEVLGTYSNAWSDVVYNEYLSTHSQFLTVEDMKKAAGLVYSEKYLESVFESVFTGIMSDDDILYARYSEDSNWIYQSSLVEPLTVVRRVYDFSSMQIVKPSSDKYLYINIDSYAPDAPDKITNFDLIFVWENNNWFLDSPTY